MAWSGLWAMPMWGWGMPISVSRPLNRRRSCERPHFHGWFPYRETGILSIHLPDPWLRNPRIEGSPFWIFRTTDGLEIGSRQRFDIGAVDIVQPTCSGGIRVEQHGLATGGTQGFGTMNPAVVQFNAMADTAGSRPNHENVFVQRGMRGPLTGIGVEPDSGLLVLISRTGTDPDSGIGQQAVGIVLR
jgi:hypothetical protein